MRTVGQIVLNTTDGRRPTWLIQCEPHVRMRLKRCFARISEAATGLITMRDTLEVARDLSWFLDRFPMKMDAGARAYLDEQTRRCLEREAIVEQVLSGGPSYVPREFPLALPPRDYQRIAADLAQRTGHLLLADDVGTGKTVSAICAIVDARFRPALVVTMTHLPLQWQAEIQRFAPGMKVVVAKSGTPPASARLGRGQWARWPDVLVISYSKLAGWALALAGKMRSVVFDECQELRHQGSNKYEAAVTIAEGTALRMGASATPVYNYGSEIYSILNVLAPGSLGEHHEFAREWTREGGKKGIVKDPKAFGSYLREQGLMLRRTRRDVGRELPGLTRVPHTIEADERAIDAVAPKAAELAHLILSHGITEKGAQMRAAEELSWKLRQATGVAKAPYVAAFVRMLLDGGEPKVVLFGWHHEVYAIWREALADLEPVLYTGQESLAQKEAARKAFVEGKARVLIMSLRSGLGLDGLQKVCRTVVFGELDWSPAVMEQDEGRIERDGQPDPVLSYVLVAATGSDPVVADVLGLKKQQAHGIRDPKQGLLEDAQIDPAKVRRLAEAFLQQRGIALPAPPPPAAPKQTALQGVA